MSSVSTIALSSLNAASLRLQVSAENIANAETSGPLPGSAQSGSYPAAFAAKRVNQTANADGSTYATVTTQSPATVSTYAPAASFANGQGMVGMPNLDLASEMVQQLTARLSFAVNAQLVKADHKMTASLLDIMA